MAADHDTVGGDLLAGTHYELVTDGPPVDRNALLDTISEHRDILGARARPTPATPHLPAAWPAPREAADQDERGYPRGDLEVQLRPVRAADRQQVERLFMPGRPACVNSSAKPTSRYAALMPMRSACPS